MRGIGGRVIWCLGGRRLADQFLQHGGVGVEFSIRRFRSKTEQVIPVPPQHRALLAIGCRVLGGRDLQLVFRGERPPPGAFGRHGIECFRQG